jgi:drug/metabolite transporter (DMT)-like permease
LDILLIILLRVVMSVSANAIQKRLLLNRAGVKDTWLLTYSLMLGPAALIAGIGHSHGDISFWRNILIGGGLDAIGNLAMVAALRATDISIFGPLNAFRPILALLAGWLFLGEVPSVSGFTGIIITIAGAFFLFTETPGATSASQPKQVAKILAFRVAGLCLGTIGAVFLKRAAMRASAELTVAAWIFFGLLPLLFLSITQDRNRSEPLHKTLARHSSWLIPHAVVFLLLQWLTIRIFQVTLLAYSFVFFQLAMLLQVIVGRLLFNEPAFPRRLLGATIMALGSALIIWKG